MFVAMQQLGAVDSAAGELQQVRDRKGKSPDSAQPGKIERQFPNLASDGEFDNELSKTGQHLALPRGAGTAVALPEGDRPAIFFSLTPGDR